MVDSLYDMSLKELEECFPVHAVMQASASKPKTPYQLDLEVKDRKPSIIPKVGDRIKIKSREWYEKWKDAKGWVHSTSDDCVFNKEMKDLCGRVLTVQGITGKLPYRRWLLNMDNHYWIPEFFEEVYPVQEQLSSKFPKIDLNSPYLHQSPYEVKGSELVLSEEEQERLKEQFFASKVEDVTKRLSAYTLIQGLDDKPRLKQIKTTHLIKLKKL